MIINNNLIAMNANRQLKKTSYSSKKTTEKLSSGYRINRAADDAAGLSISEKMRAQIRGLDRGAANLQDGINYVQVADGALNEVHSILQRINELSVQSANGTNTEIDRKALNEEVQQLKAEIDHIFTSTSFNNIQIWSEESITNSPYVSGSTQVQALKITTPSSQRITINNDNYDKIACGSYKILADQQGVSLTWTDYAGQSHTTTKASWADLEANNYSLQIADYFDPADTSLFDGNGNALFDFKVSFTVAEKATVDHMIVALNSTTMSCSPSAPHTSNFEDTTNTKVTTTGVSSGVTLNYSALYASRANANSSNGEVGYDFEQGNDTFIEATPVTANNGNLIGPTITDVNVAKSSTDTWTFKFQMEGIGEITATSKSVSYYSNDTSDDAKDLWWTYYTYPNGKRVKVTRTISSSQQGNGTLGSVMDCLTGTRNSSTPGLLYSEGLSDVGGKIYINFDLTPSTSYSYGDSKTSNSIGSLTLYIDVTQTDTEQTILDKINNALNDSAILDFYAPSTSKSYASVASSSANRSMAPEDVYSDSLSYGDVDVVIHNGANKDQNIAITYKSLRVGALGLTDTNLLTAQSSNDAIGAVYDALAIVSEQRSLFGAYQNRMEHSLAVNQNASENTSTAQSRIRDVDMTNAIVEHSKESILMQSAQAMLAQANKNPQYILSLLNN